MIVKSNSSSLKAYTPEHQQPLCSQDICERVRHKKTEYFPVSHNSSYSVAIIKESDRNCDHHHCIFIRSLRLPIWRTIKHLCSISVRPLSINFFISSFGLSTNVTEHRCFFTVLLVITKCFCLNKCFFSYVSY